MTIISILLIAILITTSRISIISTIVVTLAFLVCCCHGMDPTLARPLLHGPGLATAAALQFLRLALEPSAEASASNFSLRPLLYTNAYVYTSIYT